MRYGPVCAVFVVGVLILGALLIATGILTGFAPPSLSRQPAASVSMITASASDYAATVRVSLEITPGVSGVNRFVARIMDYDTRRPMMPDRVSLRFTAPTRPDIGASTLELRRAPDGTYQSQGDNLSMDGPWLVTVLIERQSNSLEVPLAVTARSRAQTVRRNQTSGLPTIYNIDLSGGRLLDAYLDPRKPGLNELHLTFIDARGGELSIPRPAQITAGLSGKAPVILTARRFGPGHFIADAQLGPGKWEFKVTATTGAGEMLRARFTVHL